MNYTRFAAWNNVKSPDLFPKSTYLLTALSILFGKSHKMSGDDTGTNLRRYQGLCVMSGNAPGNKRKEFRLQMRKLQAGSAKFSSIQFFRRTTLSSSARSSVQTR